jgi:DNA-binding HxlR family transcriptional regulator
MIEKLNKHFESRVRLGVMSILMVEQWVDFNGFKERLSLTDGNLASHLAALEKNEYILVHKEFIGRRPKTTYTATPLGRTAFTTHLNALENLLKGRKN